MFAFLAAKPLARLALYGSAVIGACGFLAFGVGYAVSQVNGAVDRGHRAGYIEAVGIQQKAVLDAQEEARLARIDADQARAKARAEFTQASQASREQFEMQLAKARKENALLGQCFRLPPVPLGLRPQTAPAGAGGD